MGFVTPEPRRALPGVPFIRAPIPFKRTPPSRPNHLPSLHLLTPAHQALRFQHTNWGRGGDTQTLRRHLHHMVCRFPVMMGPRDPAASWIHPVQGTAGPRRSLFQGSKPQHRGVWGEPRLEPDAQKTPPAPPQAEEGWVGKGVEQDTEGELKHLPKGVSCMGVYAGAFT